MLLARVIRNELSLYLIYQKNRHLMLRLFGALKLIPYLYWINQWAAIDRYATEKSPRQSLLRSEEH